MAKSELGKKHTCKDCGIKFYDLNKKELTCPECGVAIIDTVTGNQYEPLVLKKKPKIDKDENINKDAANVDSLDASIEGGVIEDEDNPILMDDEDIIDEENEDELIKDGEIDIPEIEGDESLIGDDDFLVEEDDIEDPELIIKPKSEDE